MTSHALDRRALLGSAVGVALFGGSAGGTESWPSRNVQVVVGFGAGGVTDVAIRLLAKELRAVVPKPIVIENRVGASGMIAAAIVARAAPDGHTLLGMPGTITIVPSVLSDVAVDVRKDLQPITIFATSPNVLVVNPDFTAHDVPEFLAILRSKPPNEFAYASSGIGTTVHLMAGMLERSAGIQMRHVPYRSSIDSIRSVMAGELPMVFSSLNSALPFIQDGSVRALAVASEKRSMIVPNVSTFGEAGLKGIISDTWFGLAGPAGLPRPLVDQIATLCANVMSNPTMKDKLAMLGAEPLMVGPDAARAQIERELVSFAELTAAMGIRRDQQ
jgi:tripartite-type tricarboxylate transporter receptor subunit TctC